MHPTPTGPATRILLHLTLISLTLSPGCDRSPTPPVPTTQPAQSSSEPTANFDPAEAERQRDPSDRPLKAEPDTTPPGAPATPPTSSPSPSNPNTFLTVAGQRVPLPPARLTLLRDGTAVLSAEPTEGGTVRNTLFLQLTPTTDGGRPWKRAVYRYRLSSPEDETSDGLYLGGPENHLRPLELDIEILRPPPIPPDPAPAPTPTVRINLTGKLVPAAAENPLTAEAFPFSAQLDLPLETEK